MRPLAGDSMATHSGRIVVQPGEGFCVLKSTGAAPPQTTVWDFPAYSALDDVYEGQDSNQNDCLMAKYKTIHVACIGNDLGEAPIICFTDCPPTTPPP